MLLAPLFTYVERVRRQRGYIRLTKRRAIPISPLYGECDASTQTHTRTRTLFSLNKPTMSTELLISTSRINVTYKNPLIFPRIFTSQLYDSKL